LIGTTIEKMGDLQEFRRLLDPLFDLGLGVFAILSPNDMFSRTFMRG
jgi:hypothetical protein